ncbi:class I SAM-dependent methyltransferase [Candidatus Kaiserbacteria bacterium]|nr:class I SAM-dependent methyltransferase [Candidatus Kaiserbacteria bacterium]
MIESGPPNDRFSGSLGEEYALLKEAVPYYGEFQNRIGSVVGNHVRQLQGDTIAAIEIGIGTGLTSQRILNADKRIKLLGIDSEPKMLNQAQETLTGFGDRISYLREDALAALQMQPGASADIVASALTIHNFRPQYRENVFREVARILKEGGLFVNGDKYAFDDERIQQQVLEDSFKDYDTFIARGRPDLKRDWIRHDLEDEKIKITESEQVHLLQALGFHNIGWEYRKKVYAIVKAIR